MQNIATFAEIRSNTELAGICKLIDQGLLTVPDINIVGSLSVKTVQKAHGIMEANQAFGKKLIMTMP